MIKLNDDELTAALRSNLEKMLKLIIQIQDNPISSEKKYEDFKKVQQRYESLLESKITTMI